ncbi:primosomal protein N' [Facklamia miroungae]|uniref:Replication restart protein PriA n=1 Tax=Facklamia miroungae TaxID=120956 RepID=A0A1G7PR76_9LACT|nr:primosomal protein N' [Facklamia miroungae]NKZ28802.1 primosomal protein N' [Facklamia miroungae]SDF88852.1 replication restart DNA helicase PriA [Facklamia miroungae]
MIAEVIIDIPTAQVNHTFDYQVDPEMEDLIKIGMRVEVPFGYRRLMAFVVNVKESTDFKGDVKMISRLIDYESFLSQELVDLSKVLADTLYAFRISVLQAMLPNILRVKYETVFKVIEPDTLADALNLSPNAFKEGTIKRETLEEFLSSKQIQGLIEHSTIEVAYQVLDQKTHKTVQYVLPNRGVSEYQEILDQLDKRSHKQGQVLAVMIDHQMTQAIELDQLAKMAQASKATIRTMVKKGWLTLEEREVYRPAYQLENTQPSQAKPLLKQQQEAFDQVKKQMGKDQAKTFLLEGVTGSGKTEVYLQLIEEALKVNKSAILLVPEIALTPQMVERVLSRFGSGVAVLHSGLSITEKYDEWRRIIRQEAKVVVGARSSIFAPLQKVGIIIIDEEHETSYKQGDNPRYHAREVAKWRSEYHGCPLVLGSATPSLESRARAEVGNYHLLKLTQRVNQQALPPVTIVDMTEHLLEQKNLELSQLLENKIAEKIAAREQVVLLLNRRGYASYLQCRSCGHVIQCPHCDISLTYHKADEKLKCHYCDYQVGLPLTCPQCGSKHLRTQGIGTQKVAESLRQLFPQTPIIRMDNDTTRRKGAHKKLLKEFADQSGAILLGTQMIAKGLDFEKVTLVGVINADTGLNMPDFRAAEKSFQLLTQVAGRTGRGRLKGEVVIQTYNPDHYVIQLAKQHDYESFFYYEMRRRHLSQYPPYFFTTLIKVSSKNRAQAQKMIYAIKDQLMNKVKTHLSMIGPSTGGIERINDYYQFHLLLKYKEVDRLQDQLQAILMSSQESQAKGIFVQIDHEPQYFI